MSLAEGDLMAFSPDGKSDDGGGKQTPKKATSEGGGGMPEATSEGGGGMPKATADCANCNDLRAELHRTQGALDEARRNVGFRDKDRERLKSLVNPDSESLKSDKGQDLDDGGVGFNEKDSDKAFARMPTNGVAETRTRRALDGTAIDLLDLPLPTVVVVEQQSQPPVPEVITTTANPRASRTAAKAQRKEEQRLIRERVHVPPKKKWIKGVGMCEVDERVRIVVDRKNKGVLNKFGTITEFKSIVTEIKIAGTKHTFHPGTFEKVANA